MGRAVMAIAVIAVITAACGTADETGSGIATLDDTTAAAPIVAIDNPISTEPEQTDEEALLVFTACMRDSGVELRDPVVDSDGNVQLAPDRSNTNFDQADIDAGLEACGDLLDGVTLGFRDTDTTEIEDDLLVFAQCMRDNGINIDDPDFGNIGAGQQGGPFGEVDTNDPNFQVALGECDDALPGFAGAGAGRAGP